MSVKVTSEDRTAQMMEGLKNLANLEVYVGVPEDETARKEGEINNAQLAFIHSNGSPLRHIPARPIIQPAIEAKGNKEPIAEELGKAARAMLDKQPEQARAHLETAGMIGQNVSRGWFDDPRNGWPPNSEETIERKGSDKPLIDTGQLRKSLTYVVKDA